MSIPFILPSPAGHEILPKWNGHVFQCGDQYMQVLEYSENFSGWSDDLTALHEEAAGESHPIDLASRKVAIAQIMKCHFDLNPVIMEIGCSSGFLLKDLVETFTEAIVIGADVVKEPLFKLASKLPGIPLIRFDLLRCPLPDQSVDILIMLNVLEHIEDDVGALNNALKLLKPGGYLIIEVPAGPHLYDSYDAELHHFRRYSSRELKRKLGLVGFQILRQSHLGFILYPAFVLIKVLNKWLPSKRKSKVVRKQVSSTSTSLLVRLAMKFESNYLNNLKLPVGIRALAVARRPK